MKQAAIVQLEEHVASQPREDGSNPTSSLHRIQISPIPFKVAGTILKKHHYLHSLPGGTMLSFGVFLGQNLLGALTLGAGPAQAYQLVDQARPDDCLTLSRLWLSDQLPRNSESRVIGFVLRNLKKHTSLKFLISYADPSQGHMGTIYQATGWVYTGLSSAMPLYDMGDGKVRHCRSLSHAYGTHSVKHFADHGVTVNKIPQMAKHRYIYFLDPSWRSKLTTPILPYPKKGLENE
ncbi:DNA methyltransferase [Chloroflexota bacterium]